MQELMIMNSKFFCEFVNTSKCLNIRIDPAYGHFKFEEDI